MHRSIPALLLSSVVLFACDSDEPSELERVAELSDVELEADDGPPAERAHERGDRHQRKLDRLCESLECSDEQREQLVPLMERLRPHRPHHRRGPHPGDATLAEAFASDSLSTADLVAHREARPRPEEPDDRVAAVVELHRLLSAEQRAIVAEKVERRGLPWLGRAGKHRPHRDGAGRHAAKKVEHLCRRLECSDDQRQRLTELAQQRPTPPEISEAERTALAEAWKGETLSAPAVQAYRDAVREAEEAFEQANDELIVTMHGVLSPTQRASLAERIRDEGLRALKLGGKGHGKRHGKHGKRRGKHGKRHGKHRRPALNDAPQAFG